MPGFARPLSSRGAKVKHYIAHIPMSLSVPDAMHWAIKDVLEGEYEWAIDDQPAKVLKVGDTFYEPAGCLHRVSKNPAAKGKTRVLAWVVHPRDAKDLVIPEKK